MRTTMTWVGFDVHARSTHGAAIDTLTGELSRMRFGPGIEGPVAWLAGLPGPVQACYEAGPTGFGLYRSAVAAGVAMPVIAPGKTPRGPSDRVKTDRKDAELLARLLLAGSLTTVVVPAPEVEAAREMTRAHDACRRGFDERRPSRVEDAAQAWPGLSEVDDLDGRAPSLALAPAVLRAGQRSGLRRGFSPPSTG